MDEWSDNPQQVLHCLNGLTVYLPICNDGSRGAKTLPR